MTGADGAPRVDANTGQQAAFDNLLLLYSAPTLRDDGRTWLLLLWNVRKKL